MFSECEEVKANDEGEGINFMFNNNNNKKPYASRMVMSGKKPNARLSTVLGMNH